MPREFVEASVLTAASRIRRERRQPFCGPCHIIGTIAASACSIAPSEWVDFHKPHLPISSAAGDRWLGVISYGVDNSMTMDVQYGGDKVKPI